MQLLELTLPFFVVVALGFYAVKFGLVPLGAEKGINAFVFNFALPALFVKSLAKQDISASFNVPFFIGYLAAGSLVSCLAMAVTRILNRASLAEMAIVAQASAIPNISFLGVPIIVAAFGKEAIVAIAVAIVAERMVLLPLLLLLLDLGRQFNADASRREGNPGQPLPSLAATSPSKQPNAFVKVIRSILLNPLLISIVVGAGFSISGFGVPAALGRFLTSLGAAAGPTALFALGASLASKDVIRQDWVPVSLGVLFKLVAHPLAVWMILSSMDGIPPQWLRVGVMIAAMPVAVNVYVSAQNCDTVPARISAITIISTVFGIFTTTVALTLFT